MQSSLLSQKNLSYGVYACMFVGALFLQYLAASDFIKALYIQSMIMLISFTNRPGKSLWQSLSLQSKCFAIATSILSVVGLCYGNDYVRANPEMGPVLLKGYALFIALGCPAILYLERNDQKSLMRKTVEFGFTVASLSLAAFIVGSFIS